MEFFIFFMVCVAIIYEVSKKVNEIVNELNGNLMLHINFLSHFRDRNAELEVGQIWIRPDRSFTIIALRDNMVHYRFHYFPKERDSHKGDNIVSSEEFRVIIKKLKLYLK